ncbi:MAG: hypothetical protein ACU0A8_15110 [Limimaricola soesokkakensis]|uniref:hypothetical protein n=1 Tax=Limimaricola soesokkakensis TaxID=1343159 RepID=UPI00405A2BBF
MKQEADQTVKDNVEMSLLETFLANYPLSPEALEDIRSKVAQAGCGFDDPMAIQIAVAEIIYYYNYAHLRILQMLTAEIVLKVIDAVRSEMATEGAALQRHNEGLARRLAGEAERHLGAIMGRVQRRLLWTSAAWIALGLMVALGAGGGAGFYLSQASVATGGALPDRISARQDLQHWSELIAKNGDMEVLLSTYCHTDSSANTLKTDENGRAFCWLPLRPR